MHVRELLHLVEKRVQPVPRAHLVAVLPARARVVEEKGVDAIDRHRLGIQRPLTGGIANLQFYGSLLQATPHSHTWIPDGVFAYQDDGALAFHPLPPPTDDDLQAIVLSLYPQIERAVSLAYPDDDTDLAPDDEHAQTLAALQTDALTV